MRQKRRMRKLNGFYVNLEYPLPNGQSVKLLEDNKVYLGNQIEIPGSGRCYGIVADEKYLEVPVWFCILIPFSVAGLKAAVAAYSLWDYERSGFVYNENKIRKHLWIFAAVLLALAYALPAAGIVLPSAVSMGVLGLFILAGLFSAGKIISFEHYREVNQELLAQVVNQMDAVKQAVRTVSDKSISTDVSITSKRRGFEYLNDLFIKRHRKILWKSTLRIAEICLVLSCAAVIALTMVPEAKKDINELIMTWLPYFTFIMYAINRGTGFTKALFMNCDHSLLTYSFYKQPGCILKLFRIRLREIMKVNALPAVVIGAGLCAILYASGGTENLLNYVVLFVSILCMSLFFSIHYLTIYYLLQPYNAGTEMKSGMRSCVPVCAEDIQAENLRKKPKGGIRNEPMSMVYMQ